MKNKFEMSRLGKLLAIEVYLSYKYLLASLLVPLFFSFFMSMGAKNDIYSVFSILASMYKGYILLGGIMYTSYRFTQMHNKSESLFWFMLPASSLEKFLSKLLATFLYFYLFNTLGFLIIILISQLFFLGNNELFSLISFTNSFLVEVFFPNASYSFKAYLVVNSIFLLGAILFKKRPALYTLISISLIIIIIVLFIVFGIINYTYALNSSPKDFDYRIIIENSFFFDYIKTSVLLLFVFFMWFISYKLMKSKQVSHGI